MAKEYRVNVYENEHREKIIARVRYNTVLDYWDGHNWANGGVGGHLGLTKLQDGRYVLIYGTQWEGERDWGLVVSAEEALQEILRSQNLDLLNTKKYKELKELYEVQFGNNEEDLIEEEL